MIDSPESSTDGLESTGPSRRDAAAIVTDDRAPRVPWGRAWIYLLSASATISSMAQIITHGQGRLHFQNALLILVCAVAAWTDAGTSRIPNPLTYTAILAGLMLNGVGSLIARAGPPVAAQWLGCPGLSQSLLGLALCGGIGIACFAAAGMGGGDVKLLAALGAVIGLKAVAPALLYALAAAMVFAMVNLIFAGGLSAAMRTVATGVHSILLLRRTPDLGAAPPPSRNVPLAVPLLIGVLLAQTLSLDPWRLLGGA